MDAGVAAILAAAITGSVAILAAALGPVTGHLFSTREARNERLRGLRLDQLARAEKSLVLQLDTASAISQGDMRLATRLLEQARDLGYANVRLIGDAEAAKEWASACALVFARLPTHPGATLRVSLLGVPLTKADRAALENARTAVLAACDRQRELVVCDRDMAILRPEQMASIIDDVALVQAAVARFASTDGGEPSG